MSIEKSDSLKIFSAAVCWTAGVYFLIWHLDCFVGVDAYYHVKISELMKDYSIVLNKFPWADCSVWKNHFFDKDWLFHLFLIPFLIFGKLTGGKAAVLTVVFVSCITWAMLLKSLKVKNIFISLILMLSCYGFISRLTMCRGHLFSILIFPLCLICIIKRKHPSLFIVSVIYSLTYAGAWQIIPVALIFDIVLFFSDKEKFSLRRISVVPAILGILTALFLNPYYPDNVYGLYIQNFIVLKVNWLGIKGVEFYLGNEFNPMTDRRIFAHYLLFIILLSVTLSFFIKKIKKSDTKKFFLAILAVIYFFFSLSSVKFSDYSVPVGIVFIAVFWDRWLSVKKIRYPVIVRLCYMAVYIFTFFVIWHYSVMRPESEGLKYHNATLWLEKQLTPKEKQNEIKPEKVVFTGSWDNTPYLFYGAPQYRYLVFLDPCFMYAYSPKKYKKWIKITAGKAIFPAVSIYKEFNAELVFLDCSRKKLSDSLDTSPYSEKVFEGSDNEKIYRIYPERFREFD
ncbi:MAG: hypothetical protein K9M56_09755 [Victivallales bacterium]|nr:hypothetical protein [Victivallales bacterium]